MGEHSVLRPLGLRQSLPDGSQWKMLQQTTLGCFADRVLSVQALHAPRHFVDGDQLVSLR
jgi:hypothetical protein